ncbi:MAG: IS110 family transposase [Dermatophilaceae bacterium]
MSPQGSFVGIDWGGEYHQICVVDQPGRVVTNRQVRHDRTGLTDIARSLASASKPVRVAIERGEGLLVEHLQACGVPVYCVSPKISARARERYRLASVKSDEFDAYVLADTLRHQHAQWRPLSTPSPLLAELRAVTRDRDRIIGTQRKVESQLRSVLEAYHPAPLHLFSSLDRDITLAFVEDYPTPEQAARVGRDRMAAFCRRHGYSGRTAPEVLQDRLRPHLLAAAAGTVAGKSFSAAMLVEQLRMLNRHVRGYDKKIAELLDAHTDAPIFLSFPGLGPVTAATLISEMGEDRARFPVVQALLAETGLAPVTRASGRTRQVRFRYAANRRMRHAIDWWAFTSLRQSDWAKQAYDAARERRHGKYRALRGIGARWMRILWRCWIDGTAYDADRHLKKGRVAEAA